MADAQLNKNKEIIEYRESGSVTENTDIRIPDSYVKNMTYADMITEFPKLVRGGQFANALVVIQGHGRFLWFYRLVERVNRLLSGRKDKAQAMGKKT